MVRTRANKHRARSNKQRGGQISYSEEDKGQMRYNGFTEDNITTLEGLNAPANTVIDMIITNEPFEILAYFRANPGQPNGSPATRIATQAFTAPALTLQNPQDLEQPESTRLTIRDLDLESPRSVAETNWGGKRRKSKKSKKTRKSKKVRKTRKSKKSRKHRGGNAPETAGVMPAEEDEFFQQQNQTNYPR
jgi:hypothetical protein